MARIQVIVTLACLVALASFVDCRKASDNVRAKRQTTEDEDALPPGALIHNFLKDVGSKEPVDLLILMDRSQGMNKFNFYIRMKKLVRTMIGQYVRMHPRYVRLALITFATYSTTIFDYISQEHDLNSKCMVFNKMPKASFDDIRYDNNRTLWADTNLKRAFVAGNKILDAGLTARPGVKQIIFVITDGNYKSGQDQDPIDEVQELHNRKVNIYTVGLGNWLVPGNVREMATNPSHYAEFDRWAQMTNDNLTSYTSDEASVWTPINSTYCNESCTDGACYCDALTGYAECLCEPGYELKNGVCTKCEFHHYKEGYGKDFCTRCPEKYVTRVGGATSRNQCVCDPNDTTCDSASIRDNMCEIRNPCDPVREQCVNLGSNRTECICRPGFSGPRCALNENDCEEDKHQCNTVGRARCFDRPDSYYCACAFGFKGRYCYETTDECGMDLCENNATCEDRENNFVCVCTPGWGGQYCQEKVTTTSTTTTTTTTTPRPTSSTTTQTTTTTTVKPNKTTEEEDDKMLIIIIACAAGGVVLLAIIIAIIVSVVMYRRRKRAEREAASAKHELQETLKRNKRPSTYRRYRNTLTKTLSQAFSGFFRKKTLRGSQYGDAAEEGLPSAPVKRRPRPDLLQSEVVGGTEEVMVVDDKQIYTMQAQKNGMEGWTSYLNDLQRSGLIRSGTIVDVDGGACAYTTDWSEFTPTEAEKCKEVLFSRKKKVPLFLGNLGEYFISENDGETCLGASSHNPDNSIVFSATRKYVVVLLGDSLGTKQLKKELQWITDHIKGEGY